MGQNLLSPLLPIARILGERPNCDLVEYEYEAEVDLDKSFTVGSETGSSAHKKLDGRWLIH